MRPRGQSLVTKGIQAIQKGVSLATKGILDRFTILVNGGEPLEKDNDWTLKLKGIKETKFNHITNVNGIKQFEKGFEEMCSGSACKVVLDWTQPG